MEIIHNGHRYRIRWRHGRETNGNDEITPKGGVTIASTILPDETMVEQYAFFSEEETYNKQLGRTISTGRLLKLLGINTKLALKCH